MQLNASAGGDVSLDAVRPYDFNVVSESQFCTTKSGAAVKCAMAFRSSDLTDAFVEGEPLFLAFMSTNVTQVSCFALT